MPIGKGPLRETGNDNINPLDLDDRTLEGRRAFLESLGASSGSPAATALADVKTEQETRRAAAVAALAERRG